jgi:hypothetical protein
MASDEANAAQSAATTHPTILVLVSMMFLPVGTLPLNSESIDPGNLDLGYCRIM